MKSIYRSSEGEAVIRAIYDRQLASLNLDVESLMVDTAFGSTHVLVAGPRSAPAVVVLQGGNTISPITLGWIRPLITKYRVYAPDTVGHPGKSAPVRLSPRDNSYGKWLVELLDGLGLEKPAVLGGSYGAGILLRAACYAPERIGKAVLFIPAGLVSIPLRTLSRLIGSLALYRLAPNRKHLEQTLMPMFQPDPIDPEVLEITEAVFRHVRIEPEMPRNVSRNELAGFKAPVFVLAAEKDRLFPADRVIRRANMVFPNLRAAETIPGVGHFLPERVRSFLNERLSRFLREPFE